MAKRPRTDGEAAPVDDLAAAAALQMRELDEVGGLVAGIVATRVEAVRSVFAAHAAAAARKLDEREAELEEAAQLVDAELREREAAVVKEREALAEEKRRMEGLHHFHASEQVVLDVGGTRFKTTLPTLTTVPGSMLASMFSGRFELAPTDGVYFIDRDPTHFRYILNALRDGGRPQPLPDGQRMLRELLKEAEFYGVEDKVLPAPPPVPPAIRRRGWTSWQDRDYVGSIGCTQAIKDAVSSAADQTLPRSVLINMVVAHGFTQQDVIAAVNNLVRDGVAYDTGDGRIGV